MSALKDLLNRYNEGDAMTNIETLIVISHDEKAAEELAALREKLAQAEAERNKIAQYIRVALDDNTAPSNLADHVLFVMIHEYDPMVKRIQRLESELREARVDA